MNTNVGAGDRGLTSLLSGERVAKTHARIEACGEVDELVSVLGALAAALPPEERGRATIRGIQATLMRAAAILATGEGSPTLAMLPPVGAEQVRELEAEIDRVEATLPTLQSFVLPGGHPTAAWGHVARTVCRRAERRALAIMGPAGGTPEGVMVAILAYLNRLSTYLFVLARYCNAVHGVPEEPWRG